MDKKQYFKDLLRGTERKGIDDLIGWLNKNGFFESPASGRYHGNYAGGLLDHSLNVYQFFKYVTMSFKEPAISKESAVIVCLLHDVCKAQLYREIPGGYKFNKEVFDKGHGKLSVEIIAQFIELTPLERNIILFHMGPYFCKEYNSSSGEYGLIDMLRAFQEPAVKIFHYSDDITAQKIDQTNEERISGGPE